MGKNDPVDVVSVRLPDTIRRTEMKADSVLPAPHLQIVQRVEQEVRNRTAGSVRGLKVLVADGNLIITGQTRTYYAKQLVTHAALETAEKLPVMNEIEVCHR